MPCACVPQAKRWKDQHPWRYWLPQWGPAPLLAEFWNKPASHEGAGSQFNVYIAFSEDIDHGYIELRDGTLEVNGGMVLEAGGVDRPPDSRRLVILPHGSGHVTITLPASEDCSIWGAICTADGKKLSNRLELTIPGPSTPVPAHAPDNAPATGRPCRDRCGPSWTAVNGGYIRNSRSRWSERRDLHLPVAC